MNPVAHIIQLCTLVYPQKYGKPDPTARGMTGSKNDQGETTWGGLAKEVRYWGEWVLKKVRAEIGDLYPLIPDPAYHADRKDQKNALAAEDEPPPGYLVPVAYLWTRTVICKNPTCKATVPLVKQTWLCKKKARYVALKKLAPKGEKRVRFHVVEAKSEKAIGFDPDEGSSGGNAACPFCGTVADSDYVKVEGSSSRIGQQLMAIVANGSASGRRDTTYISDDLVPYDDHAIRQRTEHLCSRTGLTPPTQPIVDDAKNSCWCRLYGITTQRDLFNHRQLLCLLSIAADVKELTSDIHFLCYEQDRRRAIATYLALAIDRLANYLTVLCVWRNTRTCVLPTFSRQALPMVWDYGEMNPFAGSAGDWVEAIEHICGVIEATAEYAGSAVLMRGSAVSTTMSAGAFDAVVTDPPYYDNVPYANLSDFFYVWIRQTVGDYHSQHFSSLAAPKKGEIVADACRHSGSRSHAKQFYESMMSAVFSEANRLLKQNGPFAVVYAHKTTLGWATLVDAIRRSGFQITEAWPIDTEMAGGMRTEKASLASSIFLVGRKHRAKRPAPTRRTCNRNSKPSSANGSRLCGTRASPGLTWSSPASVRAYEPSLASPA